jgi:hypothetical protein
MWTSDEWELTGVADMEAAMQWAKDHCDGRTFVVYVNVTDTRGLGLVRVFGKDPSSPWREQETG